MKKIKYNCELWIFAPNVREGGGAILLQELVAKCPNIPLRLILPENFETSPSLKSDKFSAGILGRIAAELKIFNHAKRGDTILCFNGSAPLFTSKARVLVYIQNSILLDASPMREVSFYSALRLSFERLALKFHWSKVEIFFVQTKSMRILLEEFQKKYRLPGKPILIKPFFKKPSPKKSVFKKSSNKTKTPRQFFYPALFHKYKNHYQLFLAWEMFVECVPEAKLVVTLEKSQLEDICSSRVFSEAFYKTVKCLGIISFEETQEIMSDASALVFPSKTESFGMPLLEAASMGMPIIASERDFVRDVCNPDETFDPNSAISIFRALIRFSTGEEAVQIVEGPENFWRDIESFLKNG